MNIEQLEHDLRDALAAEAQELPTGAGERVRAHDYRPRTRSLRPPIAAGALTAAAAAGGAVWALSLGPQASAAFAGWTATPTAGSPAQVRSAESACRTGWSRAREAAQRGGGPAPAGGPTLSDLQPVLADIRGPFTWVIFANSSDSVSCISSSRFTSIAANGSRSPVTVGAGDLKLTSASQESAPGGSRYSFVEGRVGTGVTAATLVLSDREHVTTTIQNGWFVAWWPGGSAASSAQVTANGETSTQRLPAMQGCPTPSGAQRMSCAGATSQAGPGTSAFGSSSIRSGSASGSGSRSGLATGSGTTPSTNTTGG